jgi:hypothetical protein
VVFEYSFEHPRHVHRFLEAYDEAAPVSLFSRSGRRSSSSSSASALVTAGAAWPVV